MKNLHDFVASIVENGGGTFSYASNFIGSDVVFEDTITIFGNDITKQIIVSSFLSEFIRSNKIDMTNTINQLRGSIKNKKLKLELIHAKIEI